MTFSVLIAAYKAAPFLPAALASLASQSHGDWELVVVEDGSNDGTEVLTRSFATAHPANKVTYQNLGQNRGVAAARNRLLGLAKGEALAFLDADDTWKPHHLASLALAIAAGAALAFTGIELWDGERGVPIGTYVPPASYLADPRTSIFRQSFIQTCSCVALPRTTVYRVGLIDETLRIGEDRDYWFRSLANQGKLICTGEITCRYTKHMGSSMTNTLRVTSDTIAFYRKHRDANDVPAKLRQERLADSLVIQGRLLRRQDKPLARRSFREAAGLQPWRIDRWAWVLASLA